MNFSSLAMRLDRSPSPALRRLGDTTFQYDALSSPGDEFRLLKILPKTTSHIKCELVRASLAQPPPYVALSYAWGDVEDTRTILLHGHEFPVTLSLWYALDRLHSRDGPVLVWADAACINQKDDGERSHQVQSMTGIYSKATSVAIWLGPESEDSNVAVQLLSDLVTYGEKNNGDISSFISSPFLARSFYSLATLFERDYWYRLWVVQEVHNARAVDVYCGSSKLPWMTYVKASVFFRMHHADLVRAFPRINASGRDCGILSQKGYPIITVLTRIGPAMLASQGMDLLRALGYHRGKSCCDPRDRVYGILGILSTQEQTSFIVDYTLSVRALYIDVVDYLLTTTRRLHVVCFSIRYPYDTRADDSFPSWLPDWSIKSSVTPLWDGRNFSASGDTDALFRFFSKRRKLMISAVRIDNIDSCGVHVAIPQGSSAAILAFLHWRSYLMQTRGSKAEDHEAFCRVLSLGGAHETTRWTDGEWCDWVYRIFASLLIQKLPNLPLDEQLAAYAKEPPLLTDSLRERTWTDYIQPSMAGRRFCITDRGLLCLGSGALGPGDIICVPLGCPTPVILRRKGTEWEFIGDIYVDGYMQGRAIEELQSGQRQLENFVLV